MSAGYDDLSDEELGQLIDPDGNLSEKERKEFVRLMQKTLTARGHEVKEHAKTKSDFVHFLKRAGFVALGDAIWRLAQAAWEDLHSVLFGS